MSDEPEPEARVLRATDVLDPADGAQDGVIAIAHSLTDALLKESPSWSGSPALTKRVARGMVRLLASLSPADAEAALAEATDVEVIVNLLERAEGHAEARAPSGPTIEERLRALQARQELLSAGGGTYSVQEVSRLLGIKPESVRARIRRGRLLAVRVGSSSLRIPTCQLDGARTVPGLSEVLGELEKARSQPWTVLSVLLEPLESLRDSAEARSILEVLRAGETEKAIDAAAFLAAQGGV